MKAQAKLHEVSQVTSIKPLRTPKVRKPAEPIDFSTLGVVGQVRIALRPTNRAAMALGMLLGGIVPTCAYLIGHGAIDFSSNILCQFSTYFVIGALLFSAPTCYTWCQRAFHSGMKAAGWVLLIEGVMVAPLPDYLHPLSWIALGYLVGINAIATGCSLALRK